MTPAQQKRIERAVARGSVIHMDRSSLPVEVKRDFDENVPQSLPVIVRYAKGRDSEFYWYRDWCYET